MMRFRGTSYSGKYFILGAALILQLCICSCVGGSKESSTLPGSKNVSIEIPKKGGDAEGISGIIAKLGKYYRLHNDATCDSSGLLSGYQSVIEINAKGEGTLLDPCNKRELNKIPHEDLVVSPFGITLEPNSQPLLYYKGGLFDRREAVPTSTSNDQPATRFWGDFEWSHDGVKTIIRVVIRAKGTVAVPTEAKAYVLRSNNSNSFDLVGTLGVIATSADSNSRAYLGTGFNLKLEKKLSVVSATLVLALNNLALTLSAASVSDTYLFPLPSTLARPPLSFSANNGYSCGLSAGQVYCWGKADQGQLGNGGSVASNSPQLVTALVGAPVSAISTGDSHACAIQNLKIFCWGKNDTGQLGNGSITNGPSNPTQISDLTNATTVSAGTHHSCAIDSKKLYCWGKNDTGELGDGTTVQRTTPVLVNGIPDEPVSVVTGSAYSCALTTKGDAYCWGENGFGQIGVGIAGSFYVTPQKLSTHKFVTLSSGGSYTCGISDQGRLYCWGTNFNATVSGDASSSAAISLPQTLSNLSNPVTHLSTGNDHACAIQAGNVWCWGDNSTGQLGQGAVSGLSPVVQLSQFLGDALSLSSGGGQGHSFARTLSDVKVWGDNRAGQLGDGSNISRLFPVTLSFP